MLLSRALVGLSIIGCALIPNSASAQDYQVEIVGPSSTDRVIPMQLNDSDFVVGSRVRATAESGWFWSPDTGLNGVDLPFPGYLGGLTLTTVNASGKALVTAAPQRRARPRLFTLDLNDFDTLTALPQFKYASALSNTGFVGGNLDPTGFSAVSSGTDTRILALRGYSQVISVSDTGNAVANVVPEASSAQVYGFGFSSKKIKPLSPSGFFASDVNTSGQIAGSTLISGDITHAALVDKGKLRVLGVLPGDQRSAATAINDHGEVVGWSDDEFGHRTPFVWDRSNGMRMLLSELENREEYTLRQALDINNRGVILAYGSVTNLGPNQTLLLRPRFDRTVLAGDLNNDGCVDLRDHAELKSLWGSRGPAWMFGDEDGDGVVGKEETRIVADHWGMCRLALQPKRSQAAVLGTIIPPAKAPTCKGVKIQLLNIATGKSRGLKVTSSCTFATSVKAGTYELQDSTGKKIRKLKITGDTAIRDLKIKTL